MTAPTQGRPRGAGKASPPVPNEDSEQAALFRMAALHTAKHPELALMFSIPNGGGRTKAEAGIFKATGVKSGVPDLFLPAPRLVDSGGRARLCAGFFLELKRREGGVVSAEQRQWIAALIAAGYAAGVYRGWETAWEAIVDYLEKRTWTP